MNEIESCKSTQDMQVIKPRLEGHYNPIDQGCNVSSESFKQENRSRRGVHEMFLSFYSMNGYPQVELKADMSQSFYMKTKFYIHKKAEIG